MANPTQANQKSFKVTWARFHQSVMVPGWGTEQTFIIEKAPKTVKATRRGDYLYIETPVLAESGQLFEIHMAGLNGCIIELPKFPNVAEKND